MKVSIILPNYNHSKYLEERLHSIFNQTYQNFEVIILDDASTDKSQVYLNKYKSHHKVSHFVVNTKNSGSPFKQWYRGLLLAKGDVVWIAESDDSCDLNFLEKSMDFFFENDIVVADTFLYHHHKNSDQPVKQSIFKNHQSKTIDISDFESCPFGNVSGLVFKKPNEQQLANSYFQHFKIIGDYVFYFETFIKQKAVLNYNTKSYFRQSLESVSNVDSKDIEFYMSYFKEHIKFLNLVRRSTEITSLSWAKPFLRRRFNRIRNRTTKKQKLTLHFLYIYFTFRFQLLKL